MFVSKTPDSIDIPFSEGAPGLFRFRHFELRAFDERGYHKHQEDLANSAGNGQIRCPQCKWQPPSSTNWYCFPMGPPENFNGGCGHGWHTFNTRGKCPGCSYQWRNTTCLNCSQTSPHDDWYDLAGATSSP